MEDASFTPREGVIDHLGGALDADTPKDKNMHLRQALQYLHMEE